MANTGVCAIVGAGSGNGLAFARRFAKAGYRLALMARDEARLKLLAQEAGGALAVPCDARDPAAVEQAFAQIERTLAPVDVLIYNAGAGKFGSVDEIAASDFESAWRVNALGCLAAVKSVLPGMRKKKSGQIVVIGATAGKRGGANFAAFAPAKFAQRGLAESLARKLGPEGIHVSYVVIDGVIDLSRTRKLMPDKPDEFFLKPEDIAESVYYVTTQPRSAWTFEYDVRPFGERW